MKKILFLGLISSLFLIMYSCNPDDDNIDNVSDDARDKITATYDCNETSQIYAKSTKDINSHYIVEIDKDTSTTDKVYIANFYNLGIDKDVTASMSGLTITIPTQTTDGIVFKGSGTIASNYKTIEWNYTADDGSGQVDTVTATYTKQ